MWIFVIDRALIEVDVASKNIFVVEDKRRYFQEVYFSSLETVKLNKKEREKQSSLKIS
jgi:hypothetical protein